MRQLELLPKADEMYRALAQRDATYEGVFFAGVRTTGVFCRPGCPARTPKRENCEFFATAADALAAGYRPCLRCRPLQPAGNAPAWLAPLLAEIDADPTRRWREADLRARDLDPGRVRRWFRAQHGLTFHGYLRARRLGHALGRLRSGDALSEAAYDHGFDSESGFRDAFARWCGDAPGRRRNGALVLVTRVLTPLGPMVAGAGDRGLCLLEFADPPRLEAQVQRIQARLACAIAPGEHPLLAQVRSELERYFAGELRRAFTVPVQMIGTEFQRAVWRELCNVPYGETRSYEEIARAVGRSGAQRAVGRANGENPVAIVVPCHRVVRADGTLCGYGGGVWRKRWLLELENPGGAQRRCSATRTSAIA